MFFRKFCFSGSPHSFLRETVAQRAPATCDTMLVCRIQRNSSTGLVSDQARSRGGGFQMARPKPSLQPLPPRTGLGTDRRRCHTCADTCLPRVGVTLKNKKVAKLLARGDGGRGVCQEAARDLMRRAGPGLGGARGDLAVGGRSLVDLDVKDLDTLVLAPQTPILITECSVQAPGEGTWRLLRRLTHQLQPSRTHHGQRVSHLVFQHPFPMLLKSFLCFC